MEEGDIIEIDIPSRKLHLDVTDTELSARSNNFKPLKKECSKFLMRYSLLVKSADKGAVLANKI